jgi:hypothetical protein
MAIANQNHNNFMLKTARLLIAVSLVMIGLYLTAFGKSWAPIAFELLEGSGIGAWLEIIVPFLTMAITGLRATFLLSARRAHKA